MFKLNVKLVLPVALAFMAPLVVLPPDVAVVVAVTKIVLPAHGSVAVAATVLGLLQDIKFILAKKKKNMVTPINSFWIIMVEFRITDWGFIVGLIFLENIFYDTLITFFKVIF